MRISYEQSISYLALMLILYSTQFRRFRCKVIELDRSFMNAPMMSMCRAIVVNTSQVIGQSSVGKW